MKKDRNDQFQITELTWERIFLHITVHSENTDTPVFFLVKSDEREKLPETLKESAECIRLQSEKCENGTVALTINMAAACGRSFLENGIWKLAAVTKEGVCPCSVTGSLGYQLDEKSRIFPYGPKKQYSYQVYFTLSASEEQQLELEINSCFMRRNDSWKKKRYATENASLKGKLVGIVKGAVVAAGKLAYWMLEKCFPKNGKRILFMSETRDALWGNLKYIEARMRERGMDQEYELNYSFRKVLGARQGIRSWIRTYCLIAKSDYIFIDDYAPIFGQLKLSDRTKLIQVWHAGEGFKSVGYSRFGKAGSPDPANSCHKTYDYVTVGSKKLIPVYEEVFGIEKEAFLPTGMARLDDFLEEGKRQSFQQEFYEQYPQMKGKKVILFAPTFRGTGQREAYYDYDQLDLKQIYEFCGEESVFLVKVHPFVKEKISIPEAYRDRIFDFAQYPNINDLYYITDLLITDYSSNYYEYALLKKPVLFFTYDRETYELLRGVHRSVKEHAPGKVCDTFEELMKALYEKDYEYEKILRFVEDNFGEYDGHACDRIIDRIILENKEVAM